MAKVIPSVKRALDILELFLGETQSLSVPEITVRLDLPRTTAHQLVHTLTTCGYIERLNNQPHRYELGLRLFELGCVYAARLNIIEEGQKIAKKVSAECDETVQMAVLDGAEAVFIIRVDSSQLLRLVSHVGSRLPAHCTAVGKMLLSAMTDEELAALYKGQKSLPAMTKNSITSIRKLVSELTAIGKLGFSYDDCESNVDSRCVAAPVYDRNGKICAAMSITVPVTRMDEVRKSELVPIVQKGAQELSRRLGYGLELIGYRSAKE